MMSIKDFFMGCILVLIPVLIFLTFVNEVKEVDLRKTIVIILED